MSQELLYTSAPRGLKQGSRGFCTVLRTEGLAVPLAAALEGMSGYRPIYPPGDPKAADNPVVYSHLKLQAGGRTCHVLSRVADYGLDYSHRANKLAHHVVLEKSELLSGGPANLLSTPGIVRTEWMGEPQVIASKSVMHEALGPAGVCRAWEQVTGDAGWAGVLAESFLRDSERLVILQFSPGQEILPLFREAISLLPPERRWDVTFSTYFTGLTVGSTCVWRATIQGSKEALDSIRFVNALRLDLTSGSLGPAKGGALVTAARQGIRPHDATTRGDVDEVFQSTDEGDEEPTKVAVANVRGDDTPSLPPRLLPGQRSGGGASPPLTSSRRGRDEGHGASRVNDHARLWYSLGAVALLIAISIGVAVGTGRFNQDRVKRSTDGVAATGEEMETRTNEGDVESVAKNTKPAEQNDPPADAEQPENKAEPVAIVEPPVATPAETIEPKGDKEAPRSRSPIRAKQLLSTDSETVEVISSADIGRSPPVLLIPSWLDGVFEVKKSETGFAIKEKQNPLGDAFAKVTVISSDAKPLATIKLHVMNAGPARELTWCGVLADSQSPDLGKQPIYFGPFPLEASKLPRTFRKKLAVLHWPLEAPLHESGVRPVFKVARLVLKFDGAPYTFTSPQNEAALISELSCEELSIDARGQSVDTKEQVTVAVSAAMDNNRPGLRIALARDKRDGLLERLHADLKSQYDRFVSDHGSLPAVQSSDIKGLIKKEANNSLGSESVAEKFRKTIDDATKDATGDAVQKLANALLDFESLYKAATHYRTWVDRFNEVKIVAARISYDLRPMKGGETVTVDVVNFDETDAGSSKTEGGKQ